MASSVADRLDGLPRKSIRMSGEGVNRLGEPDHKRLVSPEAKATVAQLIDRAIAHSGLSKKEAAYLMGYADDQSPISRWIAGIEPPSLARFVAVPALCYGLSVALAELHDGAEIKTVVTFPKARPA